MSSGRAGLLGCSSIESAITLPDRVHQAVPREGGIFLALRQAAPHIQAPRRWLRFCESIAEHAVRCGIRRSSQSLKRLQLVAQGQHLKVQRGARLRQSSGVNRKERRTEVIGEKRPWLGVHQRRQQERTFHEGQGEESHVYRGPGTSWHLITAAL